MIAILYKSLICLIIILVKECQPLKCWSCSSFFEPGCEDPFKPEDIDRGAKYFLTDCENLFKLFIGSIEEQNLTELILGPGGQPYCRKTILKVYGTTIVHRGCSFGEVSKDCAELHHEVCNSLACYEDGCNGASGIDRVNLLFPALLLLRIFDSTLTILFFMTWDLL